MAAAPLHDSPSGPAMVDYILMLSLPEWQEFSPLHPPNFPWTLLFSSLDKATNPALKVNDV